MHMHMSTKKISAIVSAIAVSAALASCGGSGSSSTTVSNTPVASANVSVVAGPSTGAAMTAVLAAAPITFSTGVPDFQTTKSTTLTVSSTTGSATVTAADGTTSTVTGPTFTVTSFADDGSPISASGVLTYGSCHFNITSTTTGWKLPAGSSVVVDPCSLTLDSKGFAVGSGNMTINVYFRNALGVIITGSGIPVTLDANGNLKVGSTLIGTASLSTGSGS